MPFCSRPGNGWSLDGGLGISIGTSGGPPLPGPVRGTLVGVICGYGVGVAVPGEPDIGAGLVGMICCSWACTAVIESAAKAMTVRMVRFINGSVGLVVCLQATPNRVRLPYANFFQEPAMKRFVLLDTAPIPENGGALCLFEYGEDFVIKIQGATAGS